MMMSLLTGSGESLFFYLSIDGEGKSEGLLRDTCEDVSEDEGGRRMKESGWHRVYLLIMYRIG